MTAITTMAATLIVPVPASMVVVIIEEGEGEERYAIPIRVAGVIVAVVIAVIVIIVTGSPVTVLTGPLASLPSAMPAMHLLDETLVHLWDCSITDV